MPAHRKIEDHWYAKGHGRRRLVHSQLDRALLFPAPKGRDATASVGPGQNFMKSSNATVMGSSGSDRVMDIIAKAPLPGADTARLTPGHSPHVVTYFYYSLLLHPH